MNHLPVLYYNSEKAWFTMAIFKDWFNKHFVPAVRRHQAEVLKLPADEVKALLILDNAPVHPSGEQLVSEDGKIRCMFLPPHVTSLIQPMDQGVILSCKRLYQRRYLDKVLVVLEDEEDVTDDTRGKKTIDNIKNYNIKSAIFNVAAAWNAVKITTLGNAWKKLLYDAEVEYDFEGFEARDFHRILRRAGEGKVSKDDVRTWLDDTESDPGFQVMTEEEIAHDVLAGDNRDDSSDEGEDDEPLPTKPKLSVVRESLDNLISYIDLSPESEIQQYYPHFRTFREIIIHKQHQSGKQLKLNSFFKPARPNIAEAVEADENIDDPRAQSLQPSTSGYQPPAPSDSE
ncbi:DDE superfamily endonuclease domain [Trinorchestia longiramus]|nr:DDE superfamily endonuclease domain [Trinorchestia longiramus]